MRPDVIADLMWQRASDCIARTAGLHFPPERRPELERGLTSAASELGFPDARACIEWLLDAPPGEPRLHALVSHLTIGDTYFFRERATFDALADHVLPQLIQRGKRSLRLWSAACSTGEEPYSLAILVRQCLPDWRDWDVTILATDINERSLQKAAEGVYGEWSFRDARPGFKESFFERTAQGRYAVREDIRDRVRFARMNLAQDTWPPMVTGANAMDLVLCRNVLMYFSNERANTTVANLLSSVASEGWLAVSPSECSHTRFAQFTTVNFPNCILYRKPAATPDHEHASLARPDRPRLNAEPIASAPPDPSRRSHESVAELNRSERATPQSTRSTRLTPAIPAARHASRARALADEGKLPEALDATELWIAADRTDAAAHYLQAMIQQELGQREAARRCLGRVIYLQPDLVLAHFALGNIARAEARPTEARRHFNNALDLLKRSPPEEPLPESDGTTAAALAEIIRTLLALPQRSELAEGVHE